MNHIFRDGEGVIHDQCQRCGASQVDPSDCAPSGIHLPGVYDSQGTMPNFVVNPLKHEQSK